MIPRFGSPPQRGQIYRRRPGAYVILPRGTNILVTVQWNDGPEVQLPGGGIDTGEHVLTALHREVMEETGWKIAMPRRLGAFRRFVFMPEYDLWAEKLCTVFVARPVRRLCAPSEPDHEAAWLSVQAAVSQLGNAGDRAFLASFARSH